MNNKSLSPSRILWMVFLFGLLFVACHIALERTLANISTDIAREKLAATLNHAIVLLDAAGFFVCYGLILGSVCRFSAKKTLPAIFTAAAVILIKHLGNLAIFLATEPNVSPITIKLNTSAALSAIGIELFQLVLVAAIILILARKCRPSVPIIAICAVMVAINVISRLIGDIDYGAPTSVAEGAIMVAYYSFDILLYGVAGFFSIGLISLITKKGT